MKEPLSIGTSHKYSLSWCEHVVQVWEQDHARVVQLLYQIPPFSRRMLAKCINFRPRFWYFLKRWTRWVELSMVLVEKGLKTTTQVLSEGANLFQKRTGETGFEALTAGLERTTIKEPIERGPCPEPEAKGRGFLLDFPDSEVVGLG